MLLNRRMMVGKSIQYDLLNRCLETVLYHPRCSESVGADGGTRTRTAFQPQDFKSRASTGFATSASGRQR